MKKFEIGDSVQLKKGVIEPYQRIFDLSGWQGRIIKTFNEECMECGHKQRYVIVEYDSITLRQMTDEYILSMINEGIDIANSEHLIKDVVPVSPRDTEKETLEVRMELYKKYDWD